MFIYFFLSKRERGRESERGRKGQGEREWAGEGQKQRETWNPIEPDMGLEITNHGIMI